jgi:predicted nucleotidyltransferase
LPQDHQALARLAGAVKRSLGDLPVIVLGSRALGTARPEADLDAYVVLPAWRVPLALRQLESVSADLRRDLGIPISLNPIPAARLGRNRGAMLPFKLRREGLLVSSPPGWTLDRSGMPPVDTAARRSYAMSGVIFLLQAAEPVARGAPHLEPPASHLVSKALLHAAQLVLSAQGQWASTLPEAAAKLGGDWNDLAAGTGSCGVWFRARDVLLPAAIAHTEGRVEAMARGLQWAGLRTVRGQPTRPSWRRPSPSAGLARAACRLVCGLGSGTVDHRAVELARSSLPGPLGRGAPTDWRGLARLIAAEWAHASPLAGI